MILCIDSNTFIWGLKKKCDSGDEALRDRAIHLFEWIDENNYHVLLPTVVLGEVLSSEPLERYPVILEMVKKNFIVAEFDQRAAIKFAQLFTNKIEEIKNTTTAITSNWQKTKVDHLIIACALVHKAHCIYSHDNGLKTFGQKYIDVKELPHLPPPKLIQKSIFEDYRRTETDEDIPF